MGSKLLEAPRGTPSYVCATFKHNQMGPNRKKRWEARVRRLVLLRLLHLAAMIAGTVVKGPGWVMSRVTAQIDVIHLSCCVREDGKDY